jgi:hypothetical protein
LVSRVIRGLHSAKLFERCGERERIDTRSSLAAVDRDYQFTRSPEWRPSATGLPGPKEPRWSAIILALRLTDPGHDDHLKARCPGSATTCRTPSPRTTSSLATPITPGSDAPNDKTRRAQAERLLQRSRTGRQEEHWARPQRRQDLASGVHA